MQGYGGAHQRTLRPGAPGATGRNAQCGLRIRRLRACVRPAQSLEFGIHEVAKCAIGNLPDQRTRALGQACLAIDAREADVLAGFGEEEFAERRRLLQSLFESVETFLANQRIGILAIGHEQEPGLATVAHARQHRFDRAPGGLPAGAVAVEAEVDIGRIAEQDLGMVAGRCRAERCHGLGDAVLVQGDHVHVALDHEQARDLLVGVAHLPQAEQFATLVEQRRLRRVEVFRAVVLAHDSATKGDGPPAPVENRKHHAIAEAVVLAAAIAAGQHAGLVEQGDALRHWCRARSSAHPTGPGRSRD